MKCKQAWKLMNWKIVMLIFLIQIVFLSLFLYSSYYFIDQRVLPVADEVLTETPEIMEMGEIGEEFNDKMDVITYNTLYFLFFGLLIWIILGGLIWYLIKGLKKKIKLDYILYYGMYTLIAFIVMIIFMVWNVTNLSLAKWFFYIFTIIIWYFLWCGYAIGNDWKKWKKIITAEKIISFLLIVASYIIMFYLLIIVMPVSLLLTIIVAIAFLLVTIYVKIYFNLLF